MKIVHNNRGCFGGYHYRIAKIINNDRSCVYKIQQIKEGIEHRYKTIATLTAIQFRAEICSIDLDNPASLAHWADQLNNNS